MSASAFLTGATGTVGSALLAQLLHSGRFGRIALLIRAADDADLERRRRELLQWCGLDESDPRWGRVLALRGDASLPRLGLSAAQFDELAATVSHIVHSAASVKLTMTLAEAERSAVVPTREVLALARAARRAGSLHKLDLVSTVGVWGRTPGVMPERPLPEVKRFHNTYEAAKASAEKEIWAMADDDGIVLSVHRPSMVVGASTDGRVRSFQVFYHLCEFLSGARTWGVSPPLGGRTLDTVPVDWVARAIEWSMGQGAEAPRVLHLCSGPQAIPVRALRDMVVALWQQGGRPVPPQRVVPATLLRGLVPVLGWLAGSRARRALRALPPVLEYLDEVQSFGNESSVSRLAAAGLALPAPSDYLPVVLRHYLAVQAERRR